MNELPNLTTDEITPIIELRDNSKRANILITIFWILIGFTFIAIISGYFELKLLEQVQQSQFIDENEANANDLRQSIIGYLQFALYIVSAIVFINWFRRAYGNLHRLGITYLKHKENMALWSWFIPFIGLYRPVQIMNEIWTETQEKLKSYNSSHVLKSGGFIIGAWWTIFIISNVLGKYILKSSSNTETLEQIINYAELTVISDFLQILEALMVIVIVFQISKMETKLLEEVKKTGGRIIYNN